MRRQRTNVYRLGVKELWSLARDPMLLILIVVSFTLMIYNAGSSIPETLHNAPVAYIDDDASPLSSRIIQAFFPPHFTKPVRGTPAQADAGVDAGNFTFVLNIPPNLQRDVLAGRPAGIQLNIDATRMSQAFTGSGYTPRCTCSRRRRWASSSRRSRAACRSSGCCSCS